MEGERERDFSNIKRKRLTLTKSSGWTVGTTGKHGM